MLIYCCRTNSTTFHTHQLLLPSLPEVKYRLAAIGQFSLQNLRKQNIFFHLEIIKRPTSSPSLPVINYSEVNVIYYLTN